jgi:hypothetical protein
MRLWMVSALLSLTFALPATAQPLASVSLAKELGTLLEQHKLDSVAARMPGEPDRFVAALYYPHAQLLVVSARYSVPVLLQEQIYGHRYRDVYTALHGAGMRDSKFFVLDTAANGLPAVGETAEIDVVYEKGVEQTTLNGDWRQQHLSKEQYHQRLDAADLRYTKMLEALIAQLKSGN